MFPLAVTTEMFWQDVPYLERVKRISELGFQVEMWDWTQKASAPSPPWAPPGRR